MILTELPLIQNSSEFICTLWRVKFLRRKAVSANNFPTHFRCWLINFREKSLLDIFRTHNNIIIIMSCNMANRSWFSYGVCVYNAGVYSVVMNESHFRDLMIQHCRPPPAKVGIALLCWSFLCALCIDQYLWEDPLLSLVLMVRYYVQSRTSNLCDIMIMWTFLKDLSRPQTPPTHHVKKGSVGQISKWRSRIPAN